MGALVLYIKFMMKNGLDFRILELDKSALKVDGLKYFIPAREVMDAIEAADNLIINGVILPKDTLEEILSLKKSGADVIVVGLTVSMYLKALL
jgi:sigma 54 modulation protein/ribosomal protein S30EA